MTKKSVVILLGVVALVGVGFIAGALLTERQISKQMSEQEREQVSWSSEEWLEWLKQEQVEQEWLMRQLESELRSVQRAPSLPLVSSQDARRMYLSELNQRLEQERERSVWLKRRQDIAERLIQLEQEDERRRQREREWERKREQEEKYYEALPAR